MIPCANPSLCGVQNHQPNTQAKCMTSPIAIGTNSPEMYLMDETDTNHLHRELASCVQKARDRLKSVRKGLGALLRRYEIKMAQHDLDDYLSIQNDYEKWSKTTHPDWRHPNTRTHLFDFDGRIKRNNINNGIDIVLSEPRWVRNKDLIDSNIEYAKKHINVYKLGPKAVKMAEDYVYSHDQNDSLARPPSQLKKYNQNLAKLLTLSTSYPKMEKKIFVWRGEKFGHNPDSDRSIILKRMNDLNSLKVGDSFSWTDPVATTLRPSIAASSFSYTKGRATDDEMDFSQIDPNGKERIPNIGFIFELETDRGVYFPRIGDGHLNENEVVIPPNMKYRVLAHYQMDNNDLIDSHGSSGEFYHVIKLVMDND